MQYFTLSFDYPGRKSEWRIIINLGFHPGYSIIRQKKGAAFEKRPSLFFGIAIEPII